MQHNAYSTTKKLEICPKPTNGHLGFSKPYGAYIVYMIMNIHADVH